MLRASIFLLAPLMSVGLVAIFGVFALAACFALALMTVVLSTRSANEANTVREPNPGTQPAQLFS